MITHVYNDLYYEIIILFNKFKIKQRLILVKPQVLISKGISPSRLLLIFTIKYPAFILKMHVCISPLP